MPSHLEGLEPRRLAAGDFYVSPAGDDANAGTDPALPWRTVQRAADAAAPGSTVHVAPGRYREKVTVRVSGSAAAGYITFDGGGTAAAADGGVGGGGDGGSAVIDGKGVRGDGRHLLDLSGCSYVRVVGFELTDNLKVSDGSGIRIEGSADHVEIRNNRIHRITGRDAMGITVYGSDPAEGVHDLVIDGNEVYDCRPARSEAVTLNGNVYRFAVTGNAVHDHNNIGIDFIGGEGVCPDPAVDQVRDGVCADNTVADCRSAYGGGFAPGLYVDGGRDIVVERNRVTGCDVGLSVGCENAGRTASGVVVRDNVIYRNRKAGFDVGGYAEDTGRVVGCSFTNNTLYQNQTATRKFGEVWIQYASNCTFESNLIVGQKKGTLLFGEVPDAVDNRSDYNLFVAAVGKAGRPPFRWRDEGYATLADYQAGAGQDAHAVSADPLFASAADADFRLLAGSPAIDRGDPAYAVAVGETDAGGTPRAVGGRVDVGAFESP